MKGENFCNKRASQTFYLERFYLKNLNGVEVKEKYQVENSNRFAILVCLGESFVINNPRESIRENRKTSAKNNVEYQRLKYNKPWFDDECSKLIDQQRQATLKLLQNPRQINEDNLENLRHNNIRTFRNQGKGNSERKINELETNNKNKNIRDL
jgi:hypothetical protein